MKKVSNLVSTILSSLVFALMPVVSQAIGLGNIMLHSHLNEPLEADIPLVDLKGFDPSDVIVNVADQQAYQEAGLQPIGWLTSIQFQVIKSEIGGRPVLKLKTKDVVKDPFVDLLIEVKWPSGRLLREYTLLLDPPKSVIPTTRSIQKKQKNSPVIGAQVEQMSYQEPQPREIPSHVGGSRYVKTVPGGTYGPIGDESLWSIAKSLSQNTHSNVHQAVMAIAEKNPHAFRDGNINYMLSGAVLKLPDKAELEQYSLEQSQYYIAMQGKTPYHEPHFSQAPTIAVAKPVVQKAHKPLKLVAPVQSLETAVRATTIQAKPENQVVMAERLTLIEEAIDTLKRSNEDMSRKNQSLQNQNQSLEKLLSMKEDEIKKLVDMVKQPSASTSTVPTVPDALTDPKLAAPVASAQTSVNIDPSQFAVAVSDIPQKQASLSETQSLTTPHLADVTQPPPAQLTSEPKPELPAKAAPNLAENDVKPNAIKVDDDMRRGQASSKAISADDNSLHLSPAKPLMNDDSVKSSSSALLWFLMIGLSAMALTFAWLRRHFIQDVLSEKINTFFSPREKETLATATVVEQPGQEIANYGLQFDLDRALDAIAVQEKKFKKPTHSSLKQVMDNSENDNRFDLKFSDAQECISYERYGQAEKILKEILQQKPDEWVAVYKLLELYVLTEKYAEFERLYEGLPKDLNDIAPRVWSKIETLHQKVGNENAVGFQSAEKTVSDLRAPVEHGKEVKASKKIDAEKEYIDLTKDYPLALEGDLESEANAKSKMNTDADTINIDALPSVEIEDVQAAPTTNLPDLQKAQIALAKAYIDMGEFEDAKGILLELKKDATGNNLKQIDMLLESITHD